MTQHIARSLFTMAISLLQTIQAASFAIHGKYPSNFIKTLIIEFFGYFENFLSYRPPYMLLVWSISSFPIPMVEIVQEKVLAQYSTSDNIINNYDIIIIHFDFAYA